MNGRTIFAILAIGLLFRLSDSKLIPPEGLEELYEVNYEEDEDDYEGNFGDEISPIASSGCILSNGLPCNEEDYQVNYEEVDYEENEEEQVPITTTEPTSTTTDRFDGFFGDVTATEAPKLEDKIDNFAASIQKTRDLANQLKNKVMNSVAIDKETRFTSSSLVAQLVEKTEGLSALVSSSERFPILLKMATKMFANVKNCQDLANIGFTQSGTYQLDPDGQDVGEDPIKVLCNFDDNTTEIVHDKTSPITIQNCILSNALGCHETALDYGYQVPISQIRALIKSSDHCEQSIRFDCFLAPLMSYGEEDKGFWKSWDGEVQYFFHGNRDMITENQTHFCQCGANGSMDEDCIEDSLPCNCDAKLPTWQFDEGIINDKDLLPITEFAYGPLEYDLEEAKVSIGSLKCGGTLGSTSCSGTSAPAPIGPPKILRDDCDMITYDMINNRIRIDIPYRNNKHCWMVVDFPKPVVTLTFDDFISENDYDWFEIFTGTSADSKEQFAKLMGREGTIESVITTEEYVIFYWKTDGSSTGSSMTGYVDL